MLFKLLSRTQSARQQSEQQYIQAIFLLTYLLAKTAAQTDRLDVDWRVTVIKWNAIDVTGRPVFHLSRRKCLVKELPTACSHSAQRLIVLCMAGDYHLTRVGLCVSPLFITSLSYALTTHCVNSLCLSYKTRKPPGQRYTETQSSISPLETDKGIEQHQALYTMSTVNISICEISFQKVHISARSTHSSFIYPYLQETEKCMYMDWLNYKNVIRKSQFSLQL